MRATIAVATFLSIGSIACSEHDFRTCSDNEFSCPNIDARDISWPNGCKDTGAPPTVQSDQTYLEDNPHVVPAHCLESIAPGPLPSSRPDGQKFASADQISHWKTTQGPPMLARYWEDDRAPKGEYLSVDVPATLENLKSSGLADLVVLSGQIQAKFSNGVFRYGKSPLLQNQTLMTTVRAEEDTALEIVDIKRISELDGGAGRFPDQQIPEPSPNPYIYRVRWADSGTPLCPNEDDDDPDRDWAVAVPGIWYKDGGYQADRRARISFACVDSPVGKCVEKLAYAPSRYDVTWENEVAACVRAMRNDVCGCGHSYTLLQTKIDAYTSSSPGDSIPPNPRPDSQEFNVYDFSNTTHQEYDFSDPLAASYWFEAAWDAEGAVCLSKLRWGAMPFDMCGPKNRLKNPRTTEVTLFDEPFADANLICDFFVVDQRPTTLQSLEAYPYSNRPGGYVYTSSLFNDLGLLEWEDNGGTCAFSTKGALYSDTWDDHPNFQSIVPPQCDNSPLAPATAEYKGNILTAAGVAVLQNQGTPYVDFMSLDTYNCGSGGIVTYACPMSYSHTDPPPFPTIDSDCEILSLGPSCQSIERHGYLIAPGSQMAFAQHVENWQLRSFYLPQATTPVGYTLQPREVPQ